VAAHNRPGVDYFDPKFTNSPLVEQGRVQARLVGKRLRQMGLIINGDDDDEYDDDKNNDVTMKDQSSDSRQLTRTNESSVESDDNGVGPIDLVICSPLTRCMETAELIFPTYFANHNVAAASAAAEQQSDDGDEHHQQQRCHDNNNNISNMVSTTTTSSTKEAGYHHHTNNNNYYKVICHGDVREAYGIHYSDRHGPISILKMRYPPNNVVYYHQPSLSVNDNDDTQWQSNVRESRKDVETRVRRFFHWLLLYLDQQQQQTTVADTTNSVAIVTHGVWMECALSMYCPEVLNFGTVRVHNCDVYEAKLAVVSTKAVADSSSTLENNQSGDKMMMVRLQDAKKLISIV
jgi:broad specificity phosphatase PhoE